MSLLGNILWVLLGGFVTFLQYLVAGLTICATIVGIPFGWQVIKLGVFALLPFGHEAYATPDADSALYTVCNVVWLVVWGVWIALTHLACALVCGITIIGIPFALQHWKLAKLAVWPFGKDIRTIA